MLVLESMLDLTLKKLLTAFLNSVKAVNFLESEGKEIATALKDLAD